MSKNENNAMFVENIYTLAKLYGLKIGEVEDKAGISRGYVSRLKKGGEEVKMQSDTVKKVADVFGCSVKAILCHDLKDMCKDDLYYFDFVLKLYDDTEHGRVIWDGSDCPNDFISEEEYKNHPYKYFYDEGWHRDANGEKTNGYVWVSKFLFDFNDGYPAIDRVGFWKCHIGNTDLLLVCSEITDNEFFEKYKIENEGVDWYQELYLKKGERYVPLCASYNANKLSDVLYDLWLNLHHSSEFPRPHLTDEIREVIDGFMGKGEEDA